MRLNSEVLQNDFVRLEPFSEAHKEGLRAACAADPATWNDLYPYSMLGPGFDFHWARIEQEIAEGKTMEEIVATEPSKEFDAKWGGQRAPARFVEDIYVALTSAN